MRSRLGGVAAVALPALLAALLAPLPGLASPPPPPPRLVVVVVVDQMRGDFFSRYAGRLDPGGFRLFLDRGAVFTEARYEHATPLTSVAHAAMMTGAYTPGHGIFANHLWDDDKKRHVSPVFDESVRTVGPPGVTLPPASPRRLAASTLGDELKLATGGQARVFSVSLKDTAANLAAGRAADGAFWIDRDTGAWITSSFYMEHLPAWVEQYNAARPAERYRDREWKDSAGNLLRHTRAQKRPDGSLAGFYHVVGATPWGNDFQLEFTRALIEQEKLGADATPDLLIVSLSAPDILGHEAGAESPAMEAMMLETDRQLAAFFAWLEQRVGLQNVWLALTSDHGVAPLAQEAQKYRLPGLNLPSMNEIRVRANADLSRQMGREAEYIVMVREWPLAFLSPAAFAAAGVGEDEAGRLAGEALKQHGKWRGYVTRAQLARGELPADDFHRRYANSYTTRAGWFVMGIVDSYTIGYPTGTDHSVPLSYDVHVPLALVGAPFRPGFYRGRVEVVDMAVTLASLLGVGRPTHAVGRVLAEALVPEAGR
jgi:predicted AlkP superfamily pyrophosphatase or phosphodiesterase